MSSTKIIIIGSGVAGLSCAIRLATQGLNVEVFEKNSFPGGKLYSFEKNGFRFDAGPSLFTQPHNIEELFHIAGEPIEDHLRYKRTESSCRYFYQNGKIINAYANRDAFNKELQALGEHHSSLEKYLSRSEVLYKKIGKIFLDNSLHKRKTWFNLSILYALKKVRFSYLFRSLSDYNDKQFRTEEVKQLFNRYATYNGSDPYRAPAMLSLIPHLEQNEGVYYPEGGMVSITNALYALAQKKGVKFNFSSPVERIIHNDGKAIGVVVNKENIFCDVVVSNVDVYYTYLKLLGSTDKAERILKQERSSSALIFYWGMKENELPLQLHNIFFSRNYRKEFLTIFKENTLPEDPTIYINITSKMEAGHAPDSKENWFVMINVPGNTKQDWEAIKLKARAIIISRLSAILNYDIESLILNETIKDPVILESETSSYKGSLYGSSSNSRMAAFKRNANFSSYVKGLYFTGGTVHPGGGIPLCLKSGKITSELITDDLKKKKSHH